MSRTTRAGHAPRADIIVQKVWEPTRPFGVPVPHPLAQIIPEPPAGTDGVFGRKNGEWVPCMPLSGGKMEGRLLLAEGEPELAREAVSKGQVDRHIGQARDPKRAAAAVLRFWGREGAAALIKALQGAGNQPDAVRQALPPANRPARPRRRPLERYLPGSPTPRLCRGRRASCGFPGG